MICWSGPGNCTDNLLQPRKYNESVGAVIESDVWSFASLAISTGGTGGKDPRANTKYNLFTLVQGVWPQYIGLWELPGCETVPFLGHT